MTEQDEKKITASREAFRWMDEEPRWEDRAYLVIIGALAAGMVAAIVALVSLR
jgi:hypothetical protein